MSSDAGHQACASFELFPDRLVGHGRLCGRRDAVAGGYLGVGLAPRVPEKIIRAAVVTVGAALTVVFFVK